MVRRVRKVLGYIEVREETDEGKLIKKTIYTKRAYVESMRNINYMSINEHCLLKDLEKAGIV